MSVIREFWTSNPSGFTRSDVAAAYLAAAEAARDHARTREQEAERATITAMATASYTDATNVAHVDAWQGELDATGIDPDLMRHIAYAEVPFVVVGGDSLAEVAVLDTFDEARSRPFPDPSIGELLAASRSAGKSKSTSYAFAPADPPLHDPRLDVGRDDGVGAAW